MQAGNRILSILAKNLTKQETQMPSTEDYGILHKGKYDLMKILSLTLLMYRKLEYV